MTTNDTPRVYFKTTTEVRNPLGDARSNRSHWRDPLEKSVIEPGFVWYFDARNGTIHSTLRYDYKHTNDDAGKGAALLAALKAASVIVDETYTAVLRDFGWGAETALRAVLDAKRITPADLRVILRAVEDERVPDLSDPALPLIRS